jgi:hypothetical protein
VERVRVGVREWLARGRPPGTRAAAAGAHLLRRQGFTLISRAEPFLVEDTEGPLLDGEVERASEWGRELARRAAQRLDVVLPSDVAANG